MTEYELHRAAKKPQAKGKTALTADEKRKRRFRGDDRLYSVRHKTKRDIAEFGSYFFQLVSISGAAYGCWMISIDGTNIFGYLMLGFCIVMLGMLEWSARVTSDGFWDEWALGRFSIKFAFLNFFVIWGASAFLTLFGIFFLSGDMQSGPGDMPSTNSQEFIAAKAQLEQAKSEKAQASKDLAVWVKAPENQCGPRGKQQFCYNLLSAKSAKEKAIVGMSNRINSLTEMMTQVYGVASLGDKDVMKYWLIKKASKQWGAGIVALLALLLYELCMWYRSKYDYEKDCELEFFEKTGKWPTVSLTKHIAPTPRKAKKKTVAAHPRLSYNSSNGWNGNGRASNRNADVTVTNSYNGESNSYGNGYKSVTNDEEEFERFLDEDLDSPNSETPKVCKNPKCSNLLTGRQKSTCGRNACKTALSRYRSAQN